MLKTYTPSSTETIDSDWFVIPKPRPHAQWRLFCLPYAGGSANTYTTWQAHLPETIELIVIQPPGRASRIFEAGFTHADDLVQVLYPLLSPLLNKPYAIFGHSMGARIGFSLIKYLHHQKVNLPIHFFASGCIAPHIERSRDTIHNTSDTEFIAHLRALNGTPEAVLQNKELMALCLPSLRADFKLAETYSAEVAEKYRCIVSIFVGEADPEVPFESAKAWAEHFLMGGKLSCFAGKHLFIEENPAQVVSELVKIIDQFKA